MKKQDSTLVKQAKFFVFVGGFLFLCLLILSSIQEDAEQNNENRGSLTVEDWKVINFDEFD